MKSILDRSFRYVPAAQTDLRKTFARLRRQRRSEAEQSEAQRAARKVTTLPMKKVLP